MEGVIVNLWSDRCNRKTTIGDRAGHVLCIVVSYAKSLTEMGARNKMSATTRRAFFGSLFAASAVPALAQQHASAPYQPPCAVCQSTDIQTVGLVVSGSVVGDVASTHVHRTLPPDQFCGNCGTRRVSRSPVLG